MWRTLKEEHGDETHSLSMNGAWDGKWKDQRKVFLTFPIYKMGICSKVSY